MKLGKRKSKTKGPYRMVDLYRDRKRHPCQVHRLVLLAFVGPCPPGMQCRHLNGDPSDNRLENLAWGTPRQNCADIVSHGTRRVAVGDKAGGAKLTSGQVAEIRRDYWAGASPSLLAVKHGVSRDSIQKAASGKTWCHLPMPSGARKGERRKTLNEAEKSLAFSLAEEGHAQSRIARTLGIDQSSVSRLLAGKARPYQAK